MIPTKGYLLPLSVIKKFLLILFILSINVRLMHRTSQYTLNTSTVRALSRNFTTAKSSPDSSLIWTISSIALVSCGGGGGGGVSVTAPTFLVRVYDGPVMGAPVYFDTDNDSDIDSVDRAALQDELGRALYVTDEYGRASGIPDEYSNSPFIADVNGARDVSTGVTLSGELWSLSRGGIATPITDLIYRHGENQANTVLNNIFGAARITISDILDIRNYEIQQNTQINSKSYLIMKAAIALTEIDRRPESDQLPTQEQTQQRIALLTKVINNDPNDSQAVDVNGYVSIRMERGVEIQNGTDPDVNDNLPVIDIGGSGYTLTEGTFTSATNTGYTYTVSDADGGTPTLAVMGDPKNRFEAVDSQIRIKAGSIFDYEDPADRMFIMTIRATDDTTGGTALSPGYTDSQTVTIMIQNALDSPPTITQSGSQYTLNEGGYYRPVNTGYSYSATDIDGGLPVLSVSGDPHDRFEMSDEILRIKSGSVFDYDTLTDRSITLTITATDTQGIQNATDTVTITFSDVLLDNPPVISRTTSSVNLNEGIYTQTTNTGFRYTASDADGKTPVLSVSGDIWDRFELDGNGNLQIKANTSFDYETVADRSITLTITATDPEGVQNTSETVAISFADISSDAYEVRVYENHPLYKPVVFPSTLDLSGYQLTTDGFRDNSKFSFTSGELKWNTVPDYEAPHDTGRDNRYEIKLSNPSSGESRRLDIIIEDIGVIPQPDSSYEPALLYRPRDIPDEHKPSDFVQHILSGGGWKAPKTGPVILTYSISTAEQSELDNDIFSNDRAKIDNFYSTLKTTLAQFETASNIKFIEIEHGEKENNNGIPHIDIRFKSGDISLAEHGGKGGFVYLTHNSVRTELEYIILHEFGHVLGLEHPFEDSSQQLTYDSEKHWPGDSSYTHSSRTVMSYLGGFTALQPADIVALQFLYGPPDTKFNGVESIPEVLNEHSPVIMKSGQQIMTFSEGTFMDSTNTGYRFTATDADGGTVDWRIGSPTGFSFEIDSSFEIVNSHLRIKAGAEISGFPLVNNGQVELRIWAFDTDVGIGTQPNTYETVILDFA
jgi:hypothetical protein